MKKQNFEMLGYLNELLRDLNTHNDKKDGRRRRIHWANLLSNLFTLWTYLLSNLFTFEPITFEQIDFCTYLLLN